MTEILDCGHEPQPTYYTAGTTVTVGNERITMTGNEVMFPGYATIRETGERLCPDCTDERQREDMRTAPRAWGYVSSDDKRVVTWTGGELAKILSIHRNDRQTFLRAEDRDGHHWAGIGPAENGTYINLRRVKTP